MDAAFAGEVVGGGRGCLTIGAGGLQRHVGRVTTAAGLGAGRGRKVQRGGRRRMQVQVGAGATEAGCALASRTAAHGRRHRAETRARGAARGRRRGRAADANGTSQPAEWEGPGRRAVAAALRAAACSCTASGRRQSTAGDVEHKARPRDVQAVERGRAIMGSGARQTSILIGRRIE